jgi:DNA-binding response OmpR family regulator
MTNVEIEILKQLTLLLVEDDLAQRNMLKKTLGVFFGNIIEAEDGLEAIEKFRSEKIDIILTDYQMPNMDGYAFVKEIREIDKKIPIIILSNISDRENLLKVIPLKLINYLVKPLLYEQITQTLHAVLEEMSENHLLTIALSPELSYNLITKTLFSHANPIDLTKNEMMLLELFIRHRGKMISDEMIEAELNEKLSYKAIKNHIYRLRQKIGKETISNVQSLGYMLHPFAMTDQREEA